MAFIPLICPNCNGQIEHKKERTFKCPFCETELLLKENNVYYVDQSVHHYHGTAPVPTRGPAAAPAKPKVKAMLGVLFLFFIIAIVFGYFAWNSLWTTNLTGNTGLPGAGHVVRTEPESEVLQSFLKDIFGKTNADPTAEELASIRYLSVGKIDDKWQFTYSFDDPFSNEQAELVNYAVEDKLLNNQRIEQKDFEAFTGLTVLKLNNEYEVSQTSDVSFSHMEDLKSYSGGFNESFRAFSQYFGEPSKILELTTQIRSNAELALLLEFTHLRSLSITYVDESVTDFHLLQQLPLKALTIETVDNLNWLSSLSSLESLTILYSDATDFNSLYALSGLRELTFQAVPNLKSIEFIKNMPSLHRLDMDRVDVVSLEALRDKGSLTILRLASLTSLDSLDVVNSLTSLSELAISSYYGTEPSLSLPLVTQAELPGSLLPDFEAPDLQSLTLRPGSSGIYGTELVKFPKLTQLSLVDSGSMYQVEALNELPALEVINASETSFYEDTHALFQLQNVTTLICSECTFSMQGNEPFRNDTLEHLTINDSYYLVNNENVQNLDKVTPYLAGMSALRSFTLQDESIQNLDFMGGWKNLEVLHVENNAISNLDPLIPLQNLKRVYITGNPVQNGTVLGDGVVY
ncbi:leucine-rich repeat domain-containing protein [Paenibacillus sp. CAU 1782]